MAGRIPHDFIDRLLGQADIVEIIGSRIQLKKAGKEFQACCPFHHEKTPSFTVSQVKQFYHCFGCQAHGSAISFLMEYDNLSFPDAVEELASHLGLEVPRDNNAPQAPDHRPFFQILEQCQQYYSQQLRVHSQAHLAVDYLKQRGLTGEIAARYQIGFAPPGWDNLLRHLGTDETRTGLLVSSGMITRSEDGKKRYDRFRERIMFPIRDRRGRTIAFGGRILGDEKPKYLNSPETPVFHKGQQLYGLYEARRHNRKLERLIVVEGYMDVVALAQFGISCAVATLGTATTEEHIDLLYRNVPEIVFCFDGDRAGRDAGWKALQTSLSHMKDGRQAKFMFLPEGEDPDTLIRKKGPEEFEKLVVSAQPLSAFLFQTLSESLDLSSIDGRARLAELARPHLQQVPKGIFRDLLYQHLNELTGQTPKSRSNRHNRTGFTKKPKTGLNTIPPVRRAIALLIHFPAECLDSDLPDVIRNSTQPGLPLLTRLYDYIKQKTSPTLGEILENWREKEDFNAISKISQLNLDILEKDVISQFKGVLQQIGQQLLDREWDELLLNKSPGTMSEAEKQRLKELQALRNPGSANKN